MSKLIYVDSLRQDILTLPNCYNGFSDTYDKACIIGVIDEQKPVDAVEVVRCKDCKHWEKTWTNDWAKDYHYCSMVDGVRKVDFYCADAERRSDED